MNNTIVKIVALTILYLLSFQLYAQECATKNVPKELDRYLSLSTLRSSSTPITFRIAVHIVTDENGNGGQPISTVLEGIEAIYLVYEQHGIYFDWNGCINEISVDPSSVSASSFKKEGSIDDHEDAIDIYVLPTNYPGGGSGQGEANMWIKSAAPAVYAHEMGHCLSLLHTHMITGLEGNDPNCIDCNLTGDYVCDTPFDPGLSPSNVSSDCEYAANPSTDSYYAFSDVIQFYPDEYNIMSYSKVYCMGYISQGQADRIRAASMIAESTQNKALSTSPIISTDLNNCCGVQSDHSSDYISIKKICNSSDEYELTFNSNYLTCLTDITWTITPQGGTSYPSITSTGSTLTYTIPDVFANHTISAVANYNGTALAPLIMQDVYFVFYDCCSFENDYISIEQIDDPNNPQISCNYIRLGNTVSSSDVSWEITDIYSNTQVIPASQDAIIDFEYGIYEVCATLSTTICPKTICRTVEYTKPLPINGIVDRILSDFNSGICSQVFICEEQSFTLTNITTGESYAKNTSSFSFDDINLTSGENCFEITTADSFDEFCINTNDYGCYCDYNDDELIFVDFIGDLGTLIFQYINGWSGSNYTWEIRNISNPFFGDPIDVLTSNTDELIIDLSVYGLSKFYICAEIESPSTGCSNRLCYYMDLQPDLCDFTGENFSVGCDTGMITIEYEIDQTIYLPEEVNSLLYANWRIRNFGNNPFNLGTAPLIYSDYNTHLVDGAIQISVPESEFSGLGPYFEVSIELPDYGGYLCSHEYKSIFAFDETNCTFTDFCNIADDEIEVNWDPSVLNIFNIAYASPLNFPLNWSIYDNGGETGILTTNPISYDLGNGNPVQLNSDDIHTTNSLSPFYNTGPFYTICAETSCQTLCIYTHFDHPTGNISCLLDDNQIDFSFNQNNLSATFTPNIIDEDLSYSWTISDIGHFSNGDSPTFSFPTYNDYLVCLDVISNIDPTCTDKVCKIVNINEMPSGNDCHIIKDLEYVLFSTDNDMGLFLDSYGELEPQLDIINYSVDMKGQIKQYENGHPSIIKELSNGMKIYTEYLDPKQVFCSKVVTHQYHETKCASKLVTRTIDIDQKGIVTKEIKILTKDYKDIKLDFFDTYEAKQLSSTTYNLKYDINKGWKFKISKGRCEEFIEDFQRSEIILDKIEPERRQGRNGAINISIYGQEKIKNWIGSKTYKSEREDISSLEAGFYSIYLESGLKDVFYVPHFDKSKFRSDTQDFYETFDKTNITIKPNPITDFADLHINIAAEEEIELHVIDITGKHIQIMKKNMEKGNNKIALDCTSLSDGVYILILETNKGIYTEKFVVLK